jgi:glucose/arabinose dehydrogenase/mono/diheme cytochrome c family protein
MSRHWFLPLLLLTLTLQGGPLVREANTTLRMPANPGGFGYQLDDAFPGLTFSNPVAIVTPPGETNRIFIIERAGRIRLIKDLAAPTVSTFLDIASRTRSENSELGLLGLAFHPQYASNGRFFVFYTTTASTGSAVNRLHDRLAEFRVSSTDADQADDSFERVLFQQFDEASNHNGGDLHFGPDGYLYISLGDEGAANDSYNNSQTITRDLFAAVARIDVDNRPGNLAPNSHPAVTANYRVPADNPYVGATSFNGASVTPTSVRTEFWAVGLRNPWRMAFDELTGELWIGDVGQNARESVFVSRSGANHGWAFREGNIAGPKSGSAPANFLTNPAFQHVPPVWAYGRGSGAMQGFAVTGGRVYRGTRLSQLYGAYVFADYGSGNVWSLRRNGAAAPTVTRLLGLSGIAAFGVDPRNGDLLMANHSAGGIHRLNYDASFTGTPLPPTLAETGAFTDLATLTPNPGIVPYTVNLPFWSDGATKRRWFSVPATNLTLTFQRTETWGAPASTVWIKHFDLELTNGVPASARRLETRFLVRNTAGVYGATYRWDSATSASLVPDEGATEDILIRDGALTRTQTWLFPSRAQCLTCHTPAAGHSLSFNTAQLNCDFIHPGGTTNQIAALEAAGYFAAPITHRFSLPAHASPTNTSASLEARARSWLAVNCAGCHRPGGTGLGAFDARLATRTDLAGLVNGPLLNDLGNASNRVFRPGDAVHSVALARLSSRGPGQMPPLASTRIDPDAVTLFTDWINTALPGFESFADWQTRWFGSTNSPNAAADADPDSDDLNNEFERLVGSDPTTPGTPWLLRVEGPVDRNWIRFTQPANRAFEIQFSDTLSQDWQPLAVPENTPFFPATAQEVTVEDDFTTGLRRFYRARLMAP